MAPIAGSRGVVMALLAVVGRNATRWLAVGIFLGLLVPDLATAARPLLTPAMFVLVVLTLLRLDVEAIVASFRRRWLLAATTLWVLVGAPLAVALTARLVGAAGFLVDHAILAASAAPVISGAAFALFLGLDAALALAIAVVGTALVPFVLPLLGVALLGVPLALEPLALLARLVFLVGGATLVAVLLRTGIGRRRLTAQGTAIDGLAVLAMLTFGVAVMDGVTHTALATPEVVVGALATVFALAIGLNLLGTLLFWPFGWRVAMTVGLMTGFKNIGLVVAALGADAGSRTVVFLGLAQFPIYLLPLAVQYLVRQRRRAEEKP